jgi:hypothetical protein
LYGRIPIFPVCIIAFYKSDFQANGVRLVLLALSITACANAKTSDNANNASLTPSVIERLTGKMGLRPAMK